MISLKHYSKYKTSIRGRSFGRRLSQDDKNKPQQYTQGWGEFYKLKFKVTPDVLIPRPETELLVDEVLKYCKLSTANCKLVLDIGTGAGNIAISLAKNLSHLGGVTIIATDISSKALKVAKQNAKLHGVDKQIIFLKSNLLSALNYTLYPKPYPDPIGASSAYTLIIVTNLPYIPSARIPYLDSSVKDFEPHLALDGGEDGLKLYRKLFKQIKAKMTPKSAGVNTKPPLGWTWKGWTLIGEIDYTHGELAVTEAQKYFPQAQVEVKTDLARLQRILLIRQFL